MIFYRNHTFISRKFCLTPFHCNSISDWKRKCNMLCAGEHSLALLLIHYPVKICATNNVNVLWMLFCQRWNHVIESTLIFNKMSSLKWSWWNLKTNVVSTLIKIVALLGKNKPPSQWPNIEITFGAEIELEIL